VAQNHYIQQRRGPQHSANQEGNGEAQVGAHHLLSSLKTRFQHKPSYLQGDIAAQQQKRKGGE
jgi:hypothetical protein